MLNTSCSDSQTSMLRHILLLLILVYLFPFSIGHEKRAPTQADGTLSALRDAYKSEDLRNLILYFSSSNNLWREYREI